MSYQYRPRGTPRRYMEGAPAGVRAQVLDIFAPTGNAPLKFDVIFEAPITDIQTGEVYGFNGLDFGECGERGCHFFLSARALVQYRDKNRRKRIAWQDLPEDTRAAVVAYSKYYEDA